MLQKEEIFKELQNSLRCLEENSFPPSQAIKLLEYEQSIVYIEDSWGPAVPYPPYDHSNGEKNNGYRRVKGDDNLVALIPEVEGFPEYRDFLMAVNAADSLIESIGCEKSFFPIDDHPSIKSQLGSYTDIVFSDFDANKNPENLLYLASIFVKALEGSGEWWSKMEVGLQKLKYLHGIKDAWGLMVRLQGYGRTKDEAKSTWSVSLSKLTSCIGEIEKEKIAI